MVKISLVPVGRDDVWPVINLKVAEAQRCFLPPNEIWLAEAPYETGCYPLGIRANGSLVGLCLLIDHREHAFLDEGDDPDAILIWRLMIAAPHQGLGYGTAALDEIAGLARHRQRSSLLTTVHERNHPAHAFYLKSGFFETGRTWDGEIELRYRLGSKPIGV